MLHKLSPPKLYTLTTPTPPPNHTHLRYLLVPLLLLDLGCESLEFSLFHICHWDLFLCCTFLTTQRRLLPHWTHGPWPLTTTRGLSGGGTSRTNDLFSLFPECKLFIRCIRLKGGGPEREYDYIRGSMCTEITIFKANNGGGRGCRPYNFPTIDPMSTFLWFYESLEKDFSNYVFQSSIWIGP